MADLTQAEANSIDASGNPHFSQYTMGTRIRNMELKWSNLDWESSVPLSSFREIASNDYQNTTGTVGGVICLNSTNVRLKRINGATNKNAVMTFASNLATGVCEAQTDIGLPSNIDTSQPIVVSFSARMQTGETSATMKIQTHFNTAAARVSSTTNLTSAWSTVTHTIPAASVNASASTLSIVLLNGKSISSDKNHYISTVKVACATTPATS